MKRRSPIKVSENALRIFLIVLGSILSTIVLSLSVMAMVRIRENNIDGAAVYLMMIFVILSLTRLLTFFRERTKISFLRFLVLLIVNIAIGVLVFFGKEQSYIYSLVGGFFCVSLILSRVFKIVQNHTVRNIVFNAILILLFALLAFGLFIPYETDAYIPLTIVCFIVIMTALLEVLSNAFSQLKLKTLFKIIVRTFALEIILGLLTMIVASSLVFMYFEESIVTFGDALWYSFAVVTTIGFGDFAATTLIGRIVTVLLGIYGIIVVAVITSIIINFYNETAGKHDNQELKEIKKESKK